MHYRTIFMSDLHLGIQYSEAETARDFLNNNTSDFLILNGDVIDFWALERKIYFPKSHLEVLQAILEKVKQGTAVTYICGNHDEILRQYIPTNIMGVDIFDSMIHTSAKGESIFVVHGDIFDSSPSWLSHLGDFLYDLLLHSNAFVNWFRRLFGLEYWSFSSYLKQATKKQIKFISNFEEKVINAAHSKGVSYVAAGHVHHAEITTMNDITYLNSGCMVESCTCIVETIEGEFQILKLK